MEDDPLIDINDAESHNKEKRLARLLRVQMFSANIDRTRDQLFGKRGKKRAAINALFDELIRRYEQFFTRK